MHHQHKKDGFTMMPRLLLFLALAALAGAAVAVIPALAAAPSEAELEVNENCVENDWPCWAAPDSGPKPTPASKLTIAAGGEIMFTDNATTKTNIVWIGTAPICSPGVPVSPTAPQAPWEGKCRFEQAGTYKFESSTLFNGGPSENYTKYEIVVEGAAIGTTPTPTTPTPTTTTPTYTTTPSELGHIAPFEEHPGVLKLAGSQHGSTVHGSIEVSQVDSGGRLEVSLLASGASLAKGTHSKLVRVGRLARSHLKTGTVSFSVALITKAKASLRRHRHLTVIVKITLAAPHGAAVTTTRSVALRA